MGLTKENLHAFRLQYEVGRPSLDHRMRKVLDHFVYGVDDEALSDFASWAIMCDEVRWDELAAAMTDATVDELIELFKVQAANFKVLGE